MTIWTWPRYLQVYNGTGKKNVSLKENVIFVVTFTHRQWRVCRRGVPSRVCKRRRTGGLKEKERSGLIESLRHLERQLDDLLRSKAIGNSEKEEMVEGETGNSTDTKKKQRTERSFRIGRASSQERQPREGGGGVSLAKTGEKVQWDIKTFYTTQNG